MSSVPLNAAGGLYVQMCEWKQSKIAPVLFNGYYSFVSKDISYPSALQHTETIKIH